MVASPVPRCHALPRHHSSIAPQRRAGAGGGLDLLHVAQQLRNGRTSPRAPFKAPWSQGETWPKKCWEIQETVVRHGENPWQEGISRKRTETWWIHGDIWRKFKRIEGQWNTEQLCKIVEQMGEKKNNRLFILTNKKMGLTCFYQQNSDIYPVKRGGLNQQDWGFKDHPWLDEKDWTYSDS